MNENPIVTIDFEESQKLADLGAIVHDLDFTMQTCSRLKVLLKENPKDNILIDNMWTAALIRYARCFASGKRYGLSKAIFDGLNGEPFKAHKMYIDLRDKHIAHSVNPFEQMKVGLMLSPVGNNEKKVVGVATLSIRLASLDVDGVHQLGMLSKVLLEKVCARAKEYEQKVLKIAKNIPVDELYNRPRLRITVPGSELADKPRV